MDEVVQTFVNKQLELKLEPQDVQDEDCDRSPPPSPKSEGANDGSEKDEEDDDDEQEDDDLVDLSGVEDSPEECEDKTQEEEVENDLDASCSTSHLTSTRLCASAVTPRSDKTEAPIGAEVITIPSDDESPPPAKKVKT